MASEIDALALETWEEAFTHPLPIIRKFEQQLRQHADTNREKLRTLVGVSYRDLLDTAERIVDMDHDMHEVEGILSETGQRCNARSVERMGKSLLRVEAGRKMALKGRNGLAAQLAILEACPTIILRILRRKGSLLLAAKLLLLSRLTHKTLSQLPDVPPILDSLRDRLGSLRTKLLRAIDKRFADPERDISKLVDDMCAFSLATSSTPSDVLQHFLKIRLRALEWHLEQHDEIREHAVKGIQLLLTTLRNAQAIFPKRLADSLVRLKDLPLIRQADVQAVPELGLNIHSRWLADELRNYTPWPRHDELQKPDADRILKSWAKSAQQAFISGLKQCLGNVTTFDDVLTIRQSLFEAWPWSGSKLPGLHSADVVDALREVFNERLKSIIEYTVAELKQVRILTQEQLKHPTSASTAPSLWDTSPTDLDPSNGGARFKTTILTRYNGFDATTSQPIQAFESWIHSMKEIQTHLKSMRDAHWDDDMGDEEDEEDLDSRQTLLAEDDPGLLQECLSGALKGVSVGLVGEFEEMVEVEVKTAGEAGMLLRILREVGRRAAGLESVLGDVVTPLTSSEGIATPLHGILAQSIARNVEPTLNSSLAKLRKAPFAVGFSLWEGRPPLPVLPSAWLFKFLKLVVREMEGAGCDLWSENAVGILKETLGELISQRIIEIVEAIGHAGAEEDMVNGDGGKDDEENDGENDEDQRRKQKLVQLLFDVLYLSAALATQPHQDTRRQVLRDAIEGTLMHTGLAELETRRLQKSAKEYWRRTYLLFGLLA